MSLPTIPSTWKRAHLSHVSKIPITNGLGEAAQTYEEGFVRYIRTTDIKGLHQLDDSKKVGLPPEVGRQALVQPGDLLMTAAGSLGTSYLHSEDSEACYAGYLVRFRADPNKVSERFIAWWTQSRDHLDQIALGAVRSTIDNFSAGKFRSMSVPVPPLDEQCAIADYLDRETSQIDGLIQKQYALIARLQERCNSITARAVTLGIRNEVTRSCPELLEGVVPKSWTVGPVKLALQSLDYLRIPLSADERGKRQGRFPYYGASGVIDHVDDFIFDEDTVLVGEDGANIVLRSSPLAFKASGRYWVNNHAHVLRPRFGNVDFWTARLEAVDFSTLASGSAQPKLTAEALRNLQISWPTQLSEQEEIATYLVVETSKIATLIGQAERFIDLAQERRSALITAAVTGQLDVGFKEAGAG